MTVSLRSTFFRGALFASALGLAAPATAADPNACALDANASGPCTLDIGLGDRPLAQTLPFDVAVYLVGTAKVGTVDAQTLTLHVFSAPVPFRLEQHCLDVMTPWERCPADKRELKCYRSDTGRPGSPSATWSWAALQGGPGAAQACTLLPGASVWKRASADDAKFSLQSPALPANSSVVFYLEVGKSPSADELAALERSLAKGVDRAVAEVLTRPTGQPWVQLHDAICSATEQAAREAGVTFSVENGALLDCANPSADRIGANQVLFSSLADMREQLRTIFKTRARVAKDAPAELEKTPTLLNLEAELGFGLKELNSPAFVLAPSALRADLGERLAADAKKLAEVKVGEVKVAEGLPDAVGAYQQSVAAYLLLVAIKDAIVRDAVVLSGSTVGSFMTRQKALIAADFGLLYGFDVEQAAPYIGTNFYFRPVNKNASLPRNPFRQPLRRMSVTVGLTLTKFDDDRTDALFASTNVVTGVGMRVTDAIRVGAGAVWFREDDPNPLSDSKHVVYSPYLSLSLDYDLSAMVKWFAKVWGS